MEVVRLPPEEVAINTSSSEEISRSLFDADVYAFKNYYDSLTSAAGRAKEDFKHKQYYTDATIVIKQDVGDEFTIKAHSIILSAYSDYFQAAFSSLFSEGKTKTVLLPPIWKPEHLKTILNMIYGANFDLTDDTVFDIYYLADYLVVKHASSICLEYIRSHLEVHQALELWKCAKRSGIPELTKLAKEFSLRNFSKIMKNRNAGLNDLNCRQLLSILRQDDLKVRNERIVLDCIYDWAIHGDAVQSLSRFQDPYFCRLLFSAVRFGNLMQSSTCNCCSFARNRGDLECVCRTQHLARTQYLCPRHGPGFEDYPLLADHVEKCSVCTKHYKLLRFIMIHELPKNDDQIKEAEMTSLWYHSRSSYETVVAIGGWNDNAPTSTIQIYNPRSNEWLKLRGDERHSRAYHGLVEVNGSLYCVGGFNGMERLSTLLCLDKKTLKWNEMSPMYEKRCYVSVVALQGYIYAIGGHDGTSRLKTVERYDPKSNQWSRITPMALVRSDACATVKGNKIYVIGGFDGDTVHNSVEVFDPEEMNWSFTISLSTPRSGVRAITCKGKLCVIGGFNGERRLKTIEVLNEQEQKWETLPGEMAVARSNFGIEVFDKYVAVFGGYDDEKRQTTDECEVFCFNEGTWFPIKQMPIQNGCSALAVVTLRRLNAHLEFDDGNDRRAIRAFMV